MKNFNHTGLASPSSFAPRQFEQAQLRSACRRLWAMLNNPYAIYGFAQADAALNEFADELQSYCREENDLAERTRTLRLTRSENL